VLRRSSALLVLLLLLSLQACGSDDAGSSGASTATSTTVATTADPGRGPADGCATWQAFLADGDRAHVDDLLAERPTGEVADAARQLLANFEPETAAGQDAHETAVDVITAALDCGDGALTAPATDLELEQWVDGAVAPDPIVVGSPYVEDDGRIANVYKGRGLGDCGTYQAWVVEDARLVLDEAREKAACDEHPLPVEQWPVVFRR
jgi:hypothetical protein